MSALVLVLLALAAGLPVGLAKLHTVTGHGPADASWVHPAAQLGVLGCAGLLAGWPEGLAVVLAVKGLARYPELREARAGEQFIIGIFASVLWSVACWAVVRALLT